MKEDKIIRVTCILAWAAIALGLIGIANNLGIFVPTPLFR